MTWGFPPVKSRGRSSGASNSTSRVLSTDFSCSAVLERPARSRRPASRNRVASRPASLASRAVSISSYNAGSTGRSRKMPGNRERVRASPLLSRAAHEPSGRAISEEASSMSRVDDRPNRYRMRTPDFSIRRNDSPANGPPPRSAFARLGGAGRPQRIHPRERAAPHREGRSPRSDGGAPSLVSGRLDGRVAGYDRNRARARAHDVQGNPARRARGVFAAHRPGGRPRKRFHFDRLHGVPRAGAARPIAFRDAPGSRPDGKSLDPSGRIRPRDQSGHGGTAVELRRPAALSLERKPARDGVRRPSV